MAPKAGAVRQTVSPEVWYNGAKHSPRANEVAFTRLELYTLVEVGVFDMADYGKPYVCIGTIAGIITRCYPHDDTGMEVVLFNAVGSTAAVETMLADDGGTDYTRIHLCGGPETD